MAKRKRSLLVESSDDEEYVESASCDESSDEYVESASCDESSDEYVESASCTESSDEYVESASCAEWSDEYVEGEFAKKLGALKTARSEAHKKARSEADKTAPSEAHNTARSEAHKKARSEAHNTARSAEAHKKARSEAHNTARSTEAHNTARSEAHNTARSEAHNTARSEAHNTARSEVHNTARSEAHNTARSEAHKKARSAEAQKKARSEAHKKARSEVHNTARSEVHNTARSEVHNTARSEAHNTARSEAHNTARSEAHNTARSSEAAKPSEDLDDESVKKLVKPRALKTAKLLKRGLQTWPKRKVSQAQRDADAQAKAAATEAEKARKAKEDEEEKKADEKYLARQASLKNFWEQGFMVIQQAISMPVVKETLGKIIALDKKQKSGFEKIFKVVNESFDDYRQQALLSHECKKLKKAIVKLVKSFGQGWKPTQWVVLKSLPGGEEQDAHIDFPKFDIAKVTREKKGTIHAGLMVGLMENTKLIVYRGCFSEADPMKRVEIAIPPGDCLIFRGDLVHAGAAYTTLNYRVHCMLPVEDVTWQKNVTELALNRNFKCDYCPLLFPTGLNMRNHRKLCKFNPDHDRLREDEKQRNVKGKTCEYCGVHFPMANTYYKHRSRKHKDQLSQT